MPKVTIVATVPDDVADATPSGLTGDGYGALAAALSLLGYTDVNVSKEWR